MSYKSPIDIFLGKILTDIEDGAFKAVQECGIFVDKDELIKALKYDRGQYEQGLSDGYSAAKAEIVNCKDCKYWVYDKRSYDRGYHFGECTCPHWEGSSVWDRHDTTAEDFCSQAERKEQG